MFAKTFTNPFVITNAYKSHARQLLNITGSDKKTSSFQTQIRNFLLSDTLQGRGRRGRAGRARREQRRCGSEYRGEHILMKMMSIAQ